MRLTKLEHAAFVIDDDGAQLVVDPGKFTRPVADAVDVTGAVAVVVTHEHDDHWTPEQLEGVRAQAPGVRFFGPAGVVRAAAAAGIAVEEVHAGDEVEVAPFRLRFFGGRHAVIHSSIPVVDNLGVLVDERVYYAGDSFAVPEGVEVDVLAAPASAPWMKISEVIDYVLALAPCRAFPTHEMLLSPAGLALSDARIGWAVGQSGGEYLALRPGDSIEI
ncbi:MBL fold metallo-hydrolase [Agromyces protaetiae]|uniref:MBL fold metallo-hydrolase n=1 Tax=Agromyces protaetiae TaxID=2509455 RepID=A0A4P6FT64_9MICO|nr:MBL fold metallo-hydrolase [Agromyces protaetiae]QAY73758.1 MBL fold metallo-hydrolase [Agromyces protaetiae]